MTNNKRLITIKRLILIVLTFFAITKVLLSLGNSFGQPQAQGRLELYQTNLVLQATEYQTNTAEDNSPDLTTAIDNVIGSNPYASALKQYQKVRRFTQANLAKFQKQLQGLLVGSSNSTFYLEQALQEEISATENFIDELGLRLGILQAQLGKTPEAEKIWSQIIDESKDKGSIQTAQNLLNLWFQQPQVQNLQDKELLGTNLESWFRYRVLSRYYQLQQRPKALQTLQQEEQVLAKQALVKLAIISVVPALGGIVGVGTIIFLLVQLLLKREESLLAVNNELAWDTPWEVEITWQVIIVGFFFIGQLLLPVLFGVVGVDPSSYSLRAKAIYVLISYLLMAFGGLFVLYWSIKRFFPLPEGWFQFKWWSNWYVWGIGGYLAALPIVVIVSLVNQQLWQGQGGSNPIILFALEAQDKVALAIFFFTASIAAPLFEEMIFRGFLLPSLTRYLPVWGSIVVSSLIFSIAHLSLSEVMPLTALGMILGFVYVRSRNLLAPMLLHSLWNAGTLMSLFVLGSS